MSGRPYIVETPSYNALSGGCKVIHRLAHELNAQGQVAFITHRTKNPEWNTPYYGDNAHNGSYEQWCREKDIIGVYPEITFGNPRGTRTIVRYLLNNAGKLSGQKSFDSTDILFAFSHMFNEFNLPEERLMFLPTIDTSIFYDPGYEKNSVVFYIGKGWKGGNNDRFVEDSVKNFNPNLVINEVIKETANDQFHLASILQRAEIFYTYDNITAMTEIARLCGARTVIIPNGEYTKEQYSRHELGWEGLGWGEIPEPFDSQAFKKKYDNMKVIFYEKLKNFIEVTQNS